MTMVQLEFTTEFKNLFWLWFDALPVKEKEKFWYYSADMAIIYFYNKVYKPRQVLPS